jgi:sulfate transport system ATP-binding protein
MQIGPAGEGTLEGTVRRVRLFGPILRAEIALLNDANTQVEIDVPRDWNLSAGDVVSLRPRRYRIFSTPSGR